MVIIVISGSVGSGKTSISNLLSEKMNFEVVHLNDIAKDFKLNDVDSLQTFDFDLNKLLEKVEFDINIARKSNKNLILESHFSHFINSNLIDVCFIVGRDLKDLKREYDIRGYNDIKQADNLEVEGFNLCFYEAIEQGYEEEKQVFLIDNDEDLIDVCDKIKRKLRKLNLIE